MYSDKPIKKKMFSGCDCTSKHCP